VTSPSFFCQLISLYTEMTDMKDLILEKEMLTPASGAARSPRREWSPEASPQKPRIIIAGGSGLLGCALTREFGERGYEVLVLTRRPERSVAGARTVKWDGRRAGPWTAELEGARAVINLTGKNVNCRYTPRALAEINASRVESVRTLGDAMHRCLVPPEVWVKASSLAIHGDAGDRDCDELAPPGTGIPVKTCQKWETAFAHSPTPRTRRVMLRMSFVLNRGAGALRILERMTRCFLGGSIGSGKQFISWIHIRDMAGIFLRAVENPNMTGLYTATSPGAVTNAEFMRRLRKILHRPWSPPVPAWLVPLGCLFLRTEPVLALTGRKGVPRRLRDEGFAFEFPDLEGALADLYENPACNDNSRRKRVGR
jgi:uncharacterized protein (TIGR01777 family)